MRRTIAECIELGDGATLSITGFSIESDDVVVCMKRCEDFDFLCLGV